ncbi:MAG: hypothetical protein NC111_03935, partial [Bacteroides sp.]|nr:hypothetical protein [Bacteroides sp.]MCM1412953.1 hypothetical protein [Bacteroides sp.]MCM1471659.1 hypothetical protein [Bacteroides sp.]
LVNFLFTHNRFKILGVLHCLQRERILDCGDDVLKMDVVGFQNCEISWLSKTYISRMSFNILIKKMVRDFDIGIVFIEDINRITYPKELHYREVRQDRKILWAKGMSVGTNIPIVVGLDNLFVVENKDCKSGFCDCDIIGVLTREYNTSTAEYSHVLELIKHRSGLIGKVNF